MAKSNFWFKILGVSALIVIMMMIFAPLCVQSNNQAVVDDAQVVQNVDVYSQATDQEWTTEDEDFNEIVEGFKVFCLVLLIVIPAGGTIYAIAIGVNMAKADGDDKRREMKKRLTNAIIGLVLVFVLMGILFLYLDNYQLIMDSLKGLFGTKDTGTVQ